MAKSKIRFFKPRYVLTFALKIWKIHINRYILRGMVSLINVAPLSNGLLEIFAPQNQTNGTNHCKAYCVHEREEFHNLPESGFSAYTIVAFSTKCLGRKYFVSLLSSQVLSARL